MLGRAEWESKSVTERAGGGEERALLLVSIKCIEGCILNDKLMPDIERAIEGR